MARKQDVEDFYKKAVEIFVERHPKYKTKLTKEHALTLMQLKLDRLKTTGDDDSALDLANYACFHFLMNNKLWDKEESDKS